MNERPVYEDLIIDATDDSDAIVSEQYLGKDFWDDLSNAKEAFRYKLDGMTPVATIPEALANKWIREGFDFWKAPAKEIIQKLRIDGYNDFVIPQSVNPF